MPAKKKPTPKLDKRVMQVFQAVFQEHGDATRAEKVAKDFRAREEKRLARRKRA